MLVQNKHNKKTDTQTHHGKAEKKLMGCTLESKLGEENHEGDKFGIMFQTNLLEGFFFSFSRRMQGQKYSVIKCDEKPLM